MATPFKIRSRLKSLLGLGAAKPQPQAAARPRFTLTVLGPEGTEESGTAQVDQTILTASGNLARPVASGCNDSTCSTCRVEVLEGAELLSPREEQETRTLAENKRDPDLRLACVAAVVQPGTVKVRAAEIL